jgi:hypothetical protein
MCGAASLKKKVMFYKKAVKVTSIGFLVTVLGGVVGFASSKENKANYKLTATWLGSSPRSELQSWSWDQLQKMKKTASREKDPRTGKLIKWEGVLLSSVVDKALEGLPVEGRAQVDLVILKNALGAQVMIPRAFISKYPVMLAWNWDSADPQDLAARGQVYSVVPWTSKPRILSEDLPLQNFFLGQITQIEFTNYRDRYGSLFLKRRTDPSAMRGEKLFVQNCASCHSSGEGPNLAGITEQGKVRQFAQNGHPVAKMILKYKDRDRQSIKKYLEAHQEELSLSVSQANTPGRLPTGDAN